MGDATLVELCELLELKTQVQVSSSTTPIENCWSKVKKFLRSTASRTYEQLDQAITDAFKSVSLC